MSSITMCNESGMTRLPIIISVPHGGETIAPELADHTLLSRKDIFSDGDPLTRSLYDFRKEVLYYIETPIARAVVDLNRPPNSMPPKHRDGIIKSHTVTGKRVYRPNRVPTSRIVRLLFNKYYLPFHQRLHALSRQPGVLCGIDCHTMLDRAPVISRHPGRRRPFICLSNRGGRRGEKFRRRRLTCPPPLIRNLAECLRREFPEAADDIVPNDPFLGGFIVRHHSHHLPWIQLELNRRAYLGECSFDRTDLTACTTRITDLRNRLLAALKSFVGRHQHIMANGRAVA
ncbi:MAG: N-formylglutamate amidohydrolase [Desulfofustis sp. PB-SRB1]|nr:N-formylglutamate amidohydrolase [Desulfofustis sp. PB-SRB1]